MTVSCPLPPDGDQLRLLPPLQQSRGGSAAGERLQLSEEERAWVGEGLWSYHMRAIGAHQCGSVVVQHVQAPPEVVWSLVRQFDHPQAYKQFVKSCIIRAGDGVRVGSVRDLRIVSGLPASSSTERLEILDERNHVIGFRVLGGEHRLQNYSSVTTLHPGSRPGSTLVLESYVVDIPEGNSLEETAIFVNTVIRCNLLSLAHVSEHLHTHTQSRS